MRKTTLIKCNNCNKTIDSLGKNKVSCRYCGKVTAIDTDDSDSDVMRRAQIFNLDDIIKKESFMRNMALGESVLTLAVGLFLLLFVTTNIAIMVFVFVAFAACVTFALMKHTKLEKTKGMKSDLDGGKLLSEY